MTNDDIQSAIERLKVSLVRAQSLPMPSLEYVEIISAKDEVLNRYKSVFADEHLPALTALEFREFLMFRNNRHWKSLHRHGSIICADMDRLRSALATLFDESRPIVERLDQLVPSSGPKFVPNLGRAIITPLLLVRYPEQYGVMNSVSVDAMKLLGIYPSESDEAETFGARYERVNSVLCLIAKRLGVDLWTLDALWWDIMTSSDAAPEPLPKSNEDSDQDSSSETIESPDLAFALEKYLHEFLFDNWDNTELGKEWKLHEIDGEEVGFKFSTDIGQIDLLAHHRTELRWLVIELKRDQTNDKTVGQVLRYMGWVQTHLASEHETVSGLIIGKEIDKKLSYALMHTTNIESRSYEVRFKLK